MPHGTLIPLGKTKGMVTVVDTLQTDEELPDEETSVEELLVKVSVAALVGVDMVMSVLVPCTS